ncbi:hypothetical protein SAV31267_010240 [Streptomyces avermitilis]|uniref:Uncharacterized protein n=1 Tax=Streptomyces avermitilis TaxID=33903 RepID=A0A4D4MJ46_STRAX|nr:hypothetical protein SAV31267_010240 [Streptomyces avermitilis]
MLVMVAPLTESIAALCLDSALSRRVGTAPLLICTDCGSLLGIWSGSMSVIFPLLMVTLTWVLPNWVLTAAPVAVVVEPLFETDAPWLAVDDEDDATEGWPRGA